MKDLSQMEREFKEYERKIQRLKQLKREFKSLSTEGFESEASAIKPRLKDLSKVDEIETDLTTLKNKINEREIIKRKRKEALDAINILNSKIKEAEKIGITLSQSTELAPSAFDKQDYDNAIGYANKGKEEIEKKIQQYKDALNQINRSKHVLNQINRSKSAIDDARRFNSSVKAVADLIEDAKAELWGGNYEDALKIAKEAKEESIRIKEDHKAMNGASKLISSVESEIGNIKNSGVKILEPLEDLIEQAKSELNKNDFERAKELADEARSVALERKESRENASESISSASKVVNNTKSTEIDVSSVEKLLSRARSSLDGGEYEEAFELSKQSEEEALRLKREYEAYREALGFVSSAESGITKIKKIGVKTPKSDVLIEQAKSELNRNNFERAKQLAKEAKKIASERKESYESALKSISSANKVINNTKSTEIDVSSAEELLSRARRSLDEGKYEEVFELSKQSEEETLKLKGVHEAYMEASGFVSSAESKITKIRTSGVKIPEALRLIGRAKAELNRNNFEKAKELVDEAKSVALERKESCEKALKSISSVDVMISDAKGYGMVVSNAEEVMKNARGLIEESEYEEAYNLSKEAERIVKKIDTNYRVAKDGINSSETTIKKLKAFCDVSGVEDILNKANFSFGEGIYEDAIEYAKQAEKTAKRLKEVSKPEIEVNLPEKSFKPNYWKTLNLLIRNQGIAHAKGVKISFSREVEVKRIDEFDINSNEEKEMSIVLKPVDRGNVPVDVKISYSDSEGKEYAAEKIFMIDVGEVERDDAKSPAAFTPKPTGTSTFPPELENLYYAAELIGRGGFARVFKAKRKTDNKTVAVKIPISLDESTGRSFLREITSWQRLNHESIMTLYDANILPTPYLEMEYADSGSLDQMNRPVSIETASDIILGIADGLSYAHDQGVIHRDLKPMNILLTEDLRPKISDWGLSKIMAESKTSSMYGFSPLYGSPEQISPNKFGRPDERTDVYQLGVIFYELLTGRPPFEGDDLVEISTAIATEEPTPPSESNPEAKIADPIILKCLAKKKDDRYQNVRELQSDLASALKIQLKESLKMSVSEQNMKRSAFYCAELCLMNARLGEVEDVMMWLRDMQNYASEKIRSDVGGLLDELECRKGMSSEEKISEEFTGRLKNLLHQVRMGR